MALPAPGSLAPRVQAALDACGVQVPTGDHPVLSPVNGEELARLAWSSAADVDAAVERAHEAFLTWRTVPAPQRGALVKRFGELLTEHKDDLATLVSIEAGKITSEARGEVQEMIDICDFAVGLSRQLYGRTMASERPGHRLMETWHPLGVVGVISAFNFPVAVWSWNTAIALVCGDPVVWKPSEKTPLTALASAALRDRAIAEAGAPGGRSARSCSAVARSARRSSPTPGSRCCRPPARPGWAAPSDQWWRTASAAACSSSAATTPRSSPRAPTSTWPCAASSSLPPVPPASAAPRCAASSPTPRS